MSVKSVKFQNNDMAWHIAANILFPKGFDESKKYATIITVHPFGSCKEQTSGNIYGKALVEQGYVVIAYDASYQGESGGSPRSLENPFQRVQDISHVIDYLVTVPYVDADRIGILGICGGGGYSVNAALTEKRIKAVVAITPVDVGRLFREGFTQYDPLSGLNAMAAQRTVEAKGGELQVNEMLPPNPDEAKKAGLTERDVFEATYYYKTSRGQQPNGFSRVLFSHVPQALSWEAFAFGEFLLTQPVMAVTGEKIGAFGAYRDSMDIYGRAHASKDRQLVTLDCSHYDLYDQEESVKQAMEKITPFFAKHIRGESA